MPWQGTSAYPFMRAGIVENAPEKAGVYALFSPKRWIYVGETADIRRRLLEHLDGDNECISREAPQSFAYELIADATVRDAREAGLIQELRPVCNERVG